MKKTTVFIKHCDECPYTDEDSNIGLYCEKLKRSLIPENYLRTYPIIPKDCPLEETQENIYSI